MKKDCLWQHLRHAWHFRQVFRHRQQARYTAKRSAGYRKKGRGTTVIHLPLQNVRGKWQLIGKNYYYFDQLGRLVRNKWVGNYHVGDNGALEKQSGSANILSVKTESGSRNSRAAGIRSTKVVLLYKRRRKENRLVKVQR